MTTGICVNGFDGPLGGQCCLLSCFFRVVELELSLRIYWGFSAQRHRSYLESSLAKKERVKEVLWASTFKYIDILLLQMLVLSGKFVSKMNYNGGNLLMCFLTLANTTGHHFLNSFFFFPLKGYYLYCSIWFHKY